MKKQFDFKLTIFLVSLFIGLLLIVLGNKNEYCLSFGIICLGFSLGMYSLYRVGQLDESLKLVDEDIEEADPDDAYTLKELRKIKSRLKKQRRTCSIVFMIGAVLLIIIGFANMF